MRVAIAGAGNVGLFIANDLRAADHDVLDHRADPRGREAGPAADADGIDWHVADCCEVNSLRDAGLDACDVVVAATGDDEDNLVMSLLAKQEFAVPRVIARVNHPKNEWLFNENWGVDLSVSTPHLITALVEEAVTVGRLVRILQFEGGQARLVEVTLADDSPVIDRALKRHRRAPQRHHRRHRARRARGDAAGRLGLRGRRRGAGDGHARVGGRGAPHPHRRERLVTARSSAQLAQQLVDRVEHEVALAVARGDALERDLATRARARRSCAGRGTRRRSNPARRSPSPRARRAPARGTMRTERTSPPTFTRVRGCDRRPSPPVGGRRRRR